MTQLLVFPERDDAEEVARRLGERYPELGAPRVVRETLAGEDDAEDAQWVVEADGFDPAVVEALAWEHDGWVETG
ncbi:hypothetical protein ACIBHX_26320 [Nonomuraea sp. NPDC050536]|uniref:hypothetical protein n=1 Tax=Nonomuraea sp. NPDC050536 TaxID=3364366 RepID=UPI0037CA3882